MYKVAVIGAGQLGSRHLQGLAKTDVPMEISVVDPSADSLKTAASRFAEIPGRNVSKVHYFDSIKGLGEEIDLAIVATTADIRAKVTRDLLIHSRTRSILFEKVLFQRITEINEIDSLLKEQQVKAWVNCPRRLYPAYKKIKKLLGGKSFFYMLDGGEWGLACNAIHFLDTIAFLSFRSEMTINTTGLDTEPVKSKRRDFIELTGTIKGTSSTGSEFILRARKGSGAPHLIAILSDDSQIIVDEVGGRMRLATKENNWTWSEEKIDIPFQSQLTGEIARGILADGRCELTPYEESALLHEEYLTALLRHLNLGRQQSMLNCPIT